MAVKIISDNCESSTGFRTCMLPVIAAPVNFISSHVIDLH